MIKKCEYIQSSMSVRLIPATVRIAFSKKRLRNFETIWHIDSPAFCALKFRYVVIVILSIVNGSYYSQVRNALKCAFRENMIQE